MIDAPICVRVTTGLVQLATVRRIPHLESVPLTNEEIFEAMRRLNAHDALVEALEHISQFDNYEPAGPAANIARCALSAAKGGA